MSAKGRKRKDGEQKEKPASEFYPTPASAILRLFQHVDHQLPDGYWLEPSAGDGAIIRTIQTIRPHVDWLACEIRPEGARQLRNLIRPENVTEGDFLRADFPGAAIQVAILNPPFTLAAQFIDKCLDHARIVVALLRLGFLGSSTERRSLFERRGHPDVYVLPERPSFTGDGQTDMADYAWMRWNSDRSQRGEVRILWDKAQGQLGLTG